MSDLFILFYSGGGGVKFMIHFEGWGARSKSFGTSANFLLRQLISDTIFAGKTYFTVG
jgi:hypothetical protein